MTTKEMVMLHKEGMSFQKIADISGLTRQRVHQRVSTYVEGAKPRQGRRFDISKIKYKGIYEYFVNNPDETMTSFTVKIGYSVSGGSALYSVRSLLFGTNSHFPINTIKNICDVVGKPFEEVFEERGIEERGE